MLHAERKVAVFLTLIGGQTYKLLRSLLAPELPAGSVFQGKWYVLMLHAERKVAVFLTLIGGQTYKLLRSLLAPELPATKKYEELTEKLAGHLAPKPLAIASYGNGIREKLGESVARYLAELRRLAEHCEFGDKLDDQLRDQFVSGLRSVATQKENRIFR